MNILVTGGLGFIGSHTIVELLEGGHTVSAVDSLVNTSLSTRQAIEEISAKQFRFEELDVRDTESLAILMEEQCIEAVIHFAALKAVGESTTQPLRYYQNNLGGLMSVLEAMNKTGVTQFIFSSSATVYGDPDSVPITEDSPLKTTTNPYGETKQVAERIITDIASVTGLKALNLRYFNPIGAHKSGKIGELPKGTPNNLVPFVTQSAIGVRGELTVFGDDYDTPDGSGVRDYIHVVDLAKAHVKALDYMRNMTEDVLALNIGTGSGASVLEVIKTFESVSGVAVPYQIGPRRAGDIATCYADPSKAENLLNWKAEKSLEHALIDAWRWQQNLSEKP